MRNSGVNEAELHVNATAAVHQAPPTQRSSEVGRRALQWRLQDLISSPDLMVTSLELGESHSPPLGLFFFLEQSSHMMRPDPAWGWLVTHRKLLTLAERSAVRTQTSQWLVYHVLF